MSKSVIVRAAAGAAALAFLCAPDAPSYAADPSISVVGADLDGGYTAYLEDVGDRIAADIALAGEASGDSGSMYIDFNGSLDDVPDFDSLASADQALLRAAKRTYDLYLAMGGEAIDRFGVIERKDNRFYVGLDGEGGRWLASADEALSFLLEELVAHSIFSIGFDEAALRCPHLFTCLLVATYTGAVETIAYVPRGTTVTLSMIGDGFRAGWGAPLVMTDPSITVLDVEFVSDENIVARVSVAETAPLGVSVIDVFNEGNAFATVERYGVHIVASVAELAEFISEPQATDADTADGEAEPSGPATLAGTGEIEALADDHGADLATATTLDGAAVGRIETTGDVDMFKITVGQAGTLAISSAGPTDVSGRLETAEGAVVAADDDGGDWYNFSLEGAVAPGTYLLSVTHCCAGTGAYGLSSSFTPN